MAMPITAIAQLPEKKYYQKFSVILVDDVKTRNRCLKLRYDVFANELGASLCNSNNELDIDVFDPHCDHLAVFDNQTNEIVATTRLLDHRASQHTDGFYSESEFNLSRILDDNLNYLEVGRTCVHPEYRRGSALPMLWQGIARFVVENRTDYLFGCCSIPLSGGDKYITNVMRYLRDSHFSPAELRVQPRVPLRLDKENQGKADDVVLPTLLKAYLRQGAYICGEPHWDAAFGVADVFVLLECSKITQRYTKHFIDRI
ncbi:MAG: GNAT family N-acyltransferase [Thioalkalispiraceae bacterium]|jgi:putative hemolysin